MPASRQISRGRLLRTKAAPPPGPRYHQFSLRDGSAVIRLFFQQDTTVCWRGES